MSSVLATPMARAPVSEGEKITGFKVVDRRPLILELADGRIARAEIQTYLHDRSHRLLGFESINHATRELEAVGHADRIEYIHPSRFTDLPLTKPELEMYLTANARFAVFNKVEGYPKGIPGLRTEPRDPLAGIENRD